MKIICISGVAHSGKDTTAGLIQKRLHGNGKRVLVTHYADLLKFMCSQLFGWDGQKDEHGRHILQYVGTDVIRKQLPDFWVDFIIRELRLFPDQWDYVIIPDCRFPNELSRLKEEGFDVTHVRIVRNANENNLTDEQRKHPSETALNDVAPDYVIQNDGTITMLAAEVMRLMKTFFEE